MHISQKQGRPDTRVSFNAATEPAKPFHGGEQSLFLRLAVTISDHAWLIGAIGSLAGC